MRYLFQPRVLQMAILAACMSALACYPRLTLWEHRPAPVWYLEAIILICCILLWAFVFAWHVPYSRRPVFILHLESIPVIIATLTGTVAAIAYHLWADPVLRAKLPEEYPQDIEHWLATVPFTLGFNLLVLIFAPYDWLMRLCKNKWVATTLTGLFGAGLLAMKIHSLPAPISPWLESFVLVGRFAAAFLIVAFYLRGGVFLVWWWSFLFESRHLFNLIGGS